MDVTAVHGASIVVDIGTSRSAFVMSPLHSNRPAVTLRRVELRCVNLGKEAGQARSATFQVRSVLPFSPFCVCAIFVLHNRRLPSLPLRGSSECIAPLHTTCPGLTGDVEQMATSWPRSFDHPPPLARSTAHCAARVTLVVDLACLSSAARANAGLVFV